MLQGTVKPLVSLVKRSKMNLYAQIITQYRELYRNIFVLWLYRHESLKCLGRT